MAENKNDVYKTYSFENLETWQKVLILLIPVAILIYAILKR